MKNKAKTIIERLLIVLILIGIVAGFSFTALFSSSTPLQKGTMDLTVWKYNESIWNSTVSSSMGPSSYFGEKANCSGATGKLTTRGWGETTLNTSDLFSTYLISPTSMAILTNLGYNQSSIDANYSTQYELKQVVMTSPFENVSISPIVYIFKNPNDLKILFDNYSSFADKVNNDPLAENIPSYSEEKFLFTLFINYVGFGAGINPPINGYLNDLVDVFSNENIRKGNNKLILDLNGVENYTVQLHFAETGLKNSITFLDEGETVFYHISSSQQEWIVWVLISIPSAAVVAVVAYVLFRRYTRKKAYEESLKEMKA